MEWADALIWESVLALPQAHSDTRMRECLHHLHLVQWAYLQIWREEPTDLPEVSTFQDLPAIHAWVREYYSQAPVYLDSLGAETLERSHTAYHRGQVNTRLRELGGDPPLVDFIAWIWMGKPGAEWGDPPAT
jgi:uncharacterized damage-inducible protein DinB